MQQDISLAVVQALLRLWKKILRHFLDEEADMSGRRPPSGRCPAHGPCAWLRI